MSPYNQAVKYLRQKYGEQVMYRAFNHLIPEDSAGIERKDIKLHLLMKSSYCSIKAKRELADYWQTYFADQITDN